MGKVFERIIANRIQNLYVEQELSNSKQFGFKTGQSTEDALRWIVRLSKNSDTKYVAVIFFDIAGAFDNLWPAVLRRIKTRCSSQLFAPRKRNASTRVHDANSHQGAG